MAVIETVAVNAVARTNNFTRGMKKIQRSAKTTREEIRGLGSVFRRLPIGLGGLAGGAISAVTLQRLSRAFLDTAASVAELADTAQKLGLTTQALHELQFAASQTGVATNVLNLAIQRFGRRLGEAVDGSKELQKHFSRLNLDIHELVDLPLDIAFERFGDALRGVENSNIRLSRAVKILDSEGLTAINTIANANVSLRELRNQSRVTAGVIDDTIVDRMRDIDAGAKRVSAAWSALWRELTQTAEVAAAGQILEDVLVGARTTLETRRLQPTPPALLTPQTGMVSPLITPLQLQQAAIQQELERQTDIMRSQSRGGLEPIAVPIYQ